MRRIKLNAIIMLSGFVLMAACKDKIDYDGAGSFEADEVIVSSRQNGQLLSFSVEEGNTLKAGDVVGQVDVVIPQLQKQQAEASIAALKQKTTTSNEQIEGVRKQLAVQQSQLEQQLRERQRTENLVKADAATRKQLDDINAVIDQLQKQISATRQQIAVYESNTSTQNRNVLSERGPLEVVAQQYQEQINRGQIVNPLTGVVLTKYALAGEMTAIGKPLYKIANIDTLTLKAYITGDKLPNIKIGQAVTIRIDEGKKNYKTYPGTVSWIADKSEFTPKTIQTKNERANLVYAVKVKVKNDGRLKIGMYGEMILGSQQ